MRQLVGLAMLLSFLHGVGPTSAHGQQGLGSFLAMTQGLGSPPHTSQVDLMTVAVMSYGDGVTRVPGAAVKAGW